MLIKNHNRTDITVTRNHYVTNYVTDSLRVLYLAAHAQARVPVDVTSIDKIDAPVNAAGNHQLMAAI